MQKTTVLKLTYSGIFIALSIILTRLFSVPVNIGGIQALRLNLGFIPIMLAGLMLGWKYGAAVGAVADILGFFVSTGGAYFPGFTLTSALVGVLPCLGLIKAKTNVYMTFAVILLTTIIATFLNTFWLVIFFNVPFKVLIIPRLISGLIMSPFYTFFVYTLKRVLQRTLVHKTV